MTVELKPASSAIVIHEGRYLLIRRGRPPAKDLFAFPGGRGEPGESPAETALRELREETGLEGEDPALFATYALPSDGGGYFLSVFLVRCRDVAGATALDDAIELGWFAAADIDAIGVPESVAECIARLETMRQSQGTPDKGLAKPDDSALKMAP